MRILLEVNQEETVLPTLERLNTEGKITIIEKGDPIAKVQAKLQQISNAIQTLKEAGIDEEVLISYINSKGIAKRDIKEILNHQKKFLKKLGIMD